MGNMNGLRAFVGALCVTLLLVGFQGGAAAQPAPSDPADPYVKSLLCR